MSDKKRFKRDYVLPVALDLARRMAPFCSRLEIAGSLRRGKPEVADIELVYVPKPADFMAPMMPNNVMTWGAEEFVAHMLTDGTLAKRPKKDGSWTWGKQNKLAVHIHTGIPVDLFSTTETSWWVTLVVRTGGKESNVALATEALRRGRKLLAYGPGVLEVATDKIYLPKSEQEVFELCGVPYKAPHER